MIAAMVCLLLIAWFWATVFLVKVQTARTGTGALLYWAAAMACIGLAGFMVYRLWGLT